MTSAPFQPKPFRIGPVVFGVVLILLGTLLLVDRVAPDLGVRIGPWWPLLLTLLGVGRLLDRGPFHLGGHILMGLSLVLLAASFQRMDLVQLYWPAGLIWLGAVFAGRAFVPPRPRHRRNSGSTPEGDA